MESRNVKIQINKAGGTASKNANVSYKIALPTVWVKEMGLSTDNRDVSISFDGEKIIIEPSK